MGCFACRRAGGLSKANDCSTPGSVLQRAGAELSLVPPDTLLLGSLSDSSGSSGPTRGPRGAVRCPCGAYGESLGGDACMVALPPPRLYLPAADWEGDLMPEWGPDQLLLHFLRSRRASGWKVGMAVALIATLGLLSGEENLYQKAKTSLAQSLREAAWNHALAGEPESKRWPWDQASPAVYAGVPRLGLSAAVHCDDTAKHSAPISGPSRKARTIT